MSFLLALFGESSQVSMMRVMSLLALLIGGYLAVTGHDTSVSIFVYSAFGAKFLQKTVEVRNAAK